MIIEKSYEFNINLNAKNVLEETAFHLVCRLGHSTIAELILNKSAEFRIDLNAKDVERETNFNYACRKGY